MPDPITLDEQGNPRQQDNGQTDWKARFDGQVRKIEQLTIEVRRLNDELVAKTSQTEQLRSQLTLKDTEKTVAISERDKRLQDTLTAKSASDSELATLRALKLKVDVANKLGRPDLMEVMDAIPNMTDPAALESVLSTFAKFTDSKVKARETQLMAGITPAVSAAISAGPALPTNPADWMKYVESKPLGSPERAKAMDDMWEAQMKLGA